MPSAHILPSPLPVGWTLETRVLCPCCIGQFRCIKPSEPPNAKKIIRHMYCEDPECSQFGNIYEVEYSNKGAVIISIIIAKGKEA